jgi:hypothetical protein
MSERGARPWHIIIDSTMVPKPKGSNNSSEHLHMVITNISPISPQIKGELYLPQ